MTKKKKEIKEIWEGIELLHSTDVGEFHLIKLLKKRIKRLEKDLFITKIIIAILMIVIFFHTLIPI